MLPFMGRWPALEHIGGALHHCLHNCRSFLSNEFVTEVIFRARPRIARQADFANIAAPTAGTLYFICRVKR